MHSRAATSGTGAFFDDLHELDMASGVWSPVSRIGGDNMPRLAAYGLCTTPEGQVFYIAGYGCSSNSSANHASAFAFFSPKSYNTIMELQIIPRPLPATEDSIEESASVGFERRPSSEGIATLNDTQGGNQNGSHGHTDLKAHENSIEPSREADSRDSSPTSSPSSSGEHTARASLGGEAGDDEEELESGSTVPYQGRVSDDDAVSRVNALLEPALYASQSTNESTEHQQKRRRLNDVEHEAFLPQHDHHHQEPQQQQQSQQQQQQQQAVIPETSFLR